MGTEVGGGGAPGFLDEVWGETEAEEFGKFQSNVKEYHILRK